MEYLQETTRGGGRRTRSRRSATSSSSSTTPTHSGGVHDNYDNDDDDLASMSENGNIIIELQNKFDENGPYRSHIEKFEAKDSRHNTSE